ncbi:sensor histidine kinase, partial [Kordiimonas marina]|uniref:sensor histidine kinase n=1 Tax=Kordiimonas marina TaxID=2872312 RepID=UPI001FF2FA28
ELLFSNLLSNAFAAQDKPEHQVRVWTWADEGRVGCCVQDNGRGIPAARLDHFWQGLESARRSEGGNGVGLGVVRRIVDAHGGTIVVTSEEGIGTEFTFSLPVPREAISRHAKTKMPAAI